MPEVIIHHRLFDHPGHYQIRVQVTLDHRWFDYLYDLEISTVSWGRYTHVTQINGWLADQTALTGLLDLLNDLGGVILTVERLESPGELQ